MSKKELVRKALEHGLLLTPEMLEKIDAAGLEAILARAEQSGPVLDVQEKKSQITVKIKKTKTKEELTPKDFVQFYNAKYAGIRDMLLRKTQAVSINKLKGTPSDATLIGIVREHTQKGFVVEDPTGEIEIVSNRRPELDDVLGIRGRAREGRFFPKEYIYPDIPLNHRPLRVPGVCIVLSSLPRPEAKADLVFAPDSTDKSTIALGVNPAWINISKSGQKITLLAYAPFQETTPKDATVWLKKRYLPHRKTDITGPENPFLIKNVPEILWVISTEPGIELYKGVTVVSCGRGSCRIGLSDMKVEFL